MTDLAARMAGHAARVEALLLKILPEPEGPYARLQEAMRYGVLDGGKRLRPFLVHAGSSLFGVPEEQAARVGAAVELVHGYSLIHDDLPCMDNAAIRRGRPSCHRRFDEATALLAGDALQSLAFETLTEEAAHPDAAVRLALVRRLAIAAGAAGMCGGQMMDLLAEQQQLDVDRIIRLQSLKTGALFRFCCEAGAILGNALPPARQALAGYADDLGLAFQISDDLLDATGDPALAGKTLRQDAAVGKATLVGLLGVEGAKDRLRALEASARRRLEPLGDGAALLRDIFAFVVSRSY